MGSVHVEHKGDMLFESTVGNHKVTIDLPATVGGKDRAPTPPEFCAVSLASCVGAMAAIFCKNSKIDPSGIEVDLTFDKVENPSRLANFKVKLKVPNADPERHHKGLMKIAHMCPVHATMAHGCEVEFELV